MFQSPMLPWRINGSGVLWFRKIQGTLALTRRWTGMMTAGSFYLIGAALLFVGIAYGAFLDVRRVAQRRLERKD